MYRHIVGFAIWAILINIPVFAHQGSDDISSSNDPRSISISGTVYADDGVTPLAQIPVRARYYQINGYSPTACTDTNGNYQITGVISAVGLNILAGGSSAVCSNTSYTAKYYYPFGVWYYYYSSVSGKNFNLSKSTGVSLSKTTLDITEGSTSDSYTIALNTSPSAGSVDITITPDVQCDIGVGAGVAKVLNFTTTAAQTITVSAYDDAVSEGLHTCTLTNAITGSGAPEYPVTTLPNTTVNITDNDFELLTNGGFEIQGATGSTALNWLGVKLISANDRRKCNTDTKTYAFEGVCAFRFNSNGLTTGRSLKQILLSPDVTVGNVITLTAQVKATGLVKNARISVKAFYPVGTQKFVVPIMAGSYAYKIFRGEMTLTDTPIKLQVSVESLSTTGTFWVDDIHMSKSIMIPDQTKPVLPFPEISIGFRK